MLTLRDIRRHGPCEDGWRKLLEHLGKTKADNDPLSLAVILDSNGLDDTLWCLRALPEDMDNAVRLLACDLVEPAMAFTVDERPAEALRVARAFARGEATCKELEASRDAAWDAAWEAGMSASRVAARAAAGAASWAARGAREAAWDAAGAAAWAAREAREAAWDAQAVIFCKWISDNKL